MIWESEYSMHMRLSNWASVAVFGALAISLLLVLPAPAQVNGPPTSVTSPGFGGNAINGTRASVTSLGPQGYTPVGPPFFAAGNGFHNHDGDGKSFHHHDGDGKRFHQGDGDGHGDGHRHRRQDSGAVGPEWYPYAVPYAVESAPAEDQSETAEDDADYQGGPTVFDRRGSGEHSYVPPVKNPPAAHAPERAEAEAPAAEPDPPLPPTTLVFKDGHTVEVANYAIQGSTLFDLTAGHRRKIAIADLDLEATRRQNDEHGVTFQLPQGTRVN